MLAINVFAADSDAEARFLRSSMVQAFVNLRTGNPGPLPRPVEDVERGSTRWRWRWPSGRCLLGGRARRRRCGGRSRPSSSATRPDELILTGQIHDHAARLRSFEIAAEVLAEGQRAPA